MIWKASKPEIDQTLSFPKTELIGDRIMMRPPALSDWQDWAAVRENNFDHIQPFDPKWPKDAYTQDLFKRRTYRQSREWALGRANAFLIFTKDHRRLIGGMNINNICRGSAQFASIGYWIDKEFEGQGYMAEAIRLTLHYCFEVLLLHRVNASCLPHNERSQKTLLNAGFKKEGFAEKYLQINGVWEDHELYGLCVENWKDSGL